MTGLLAFDELAVLTVTSALDEDGLAEDEDNGVPASLCKRV